MAVHEDLDPEIFHFMPDNEVSKHLFSENCGCKPVLYGVKVWVHNPFDFRAVDFAISADKMILRYVNVH